MLIFLPGQVFSQYPEQEEPAHHTSICDQDIGFR